MNTWTNEKFISEFPIVPCSKRVKLRLNVTRKRLYATILKKYVRTLLALFGFVSCAKYEILSGHN